MTTATSARVDRTARRRRLRLPVAATAAAAVGLVVVYLVDPSEAGHYPLCPFRAVTGFDCPGCGATRGTHDLLHGDLAAALDHNVLLAVAIPLLVLAWWGWLRRSWTGSVAQRQVPNAVLYAVVVVVVTFWVVRNLPGVPFLASGCSAVSDRGARP